MTAWVTALTAAIGATQLLSNDVVAGLQRNRHQLVAGQWWRLVTPMFVQPSGIGQYLFNLVGGVLVGIAVERRLTAARWLIVYFGAGLAGNVMSYVWFPAQTGGGSSDGVAGLIGALVLTWWLTRSEPWWPAYLYGAFFAAYLTGLAAGGVVTSTLAGALTIAVLTTIRRHLPAVWSRIGVCVLVVGCAVALAVLRDDHGVGLLAGMLLVIGGHNRHGIVPRWRERR